MTREVVACCSLATREYSRRCTRAVPYLLTKDSDETDVEGFQESNVHDHSSVADDNSDNQSGSGSGSNSVSMSDTPRSCHSSSSAKEDSDDISPTDKVGIKGKKRK